MIKKSQLQIQYRLGAVYYIQFFWYNVNIKTRVNWNSTTSTFRFFGFKMNPEITQFDII
jgi:hypothetical protein